MGYNCSFVVYRSATVFYNIDWNSAWNSVSEFAGFVLYPFGCCEVYSGKIGHFLFNILWIMLCGWEIVIASFCIGLIWCTTIVGIPFGIQSITFAQLAIMLFGAEVVRA